MAFVKVPTPSGKSVYFVNPEAVCFVTEMSSNPGQCTLHFSRDHTLLVGVGHAAFVDLVKSG